MLMNVIETTLPLTEIGGELPPLSTALFLIIKKLMKVVGGNYHTLQ
jgi:hypothetical protein